MIASVFYKHMQQNPGIIDIQGSGVGNKSGKRSRKIYPCLFWKKN